MASNSIDSTPLLSKVSQDSIDNNLNTTNNSSYNRTAAFFVFLFPALGGLLFGYNIGATSTAIIFRLFLSI
jgi:hypothetical protein